MSPAVMQLPAAATARATGAPFVTAIEGDGNEPDLRRGDAVIVVPVPGLYDGEGYYAFDFRALFGPGVADVTAIYMASGLCKPGHVRLWQANRLYSTWKEPVLVTRTEFERSVLGKVAAHVRVLDHRLFPKNF